MPGAPKLVEIDLATNQVTKVIAIPGTVALQGSYLNDIRFSPNGTIGYITDNRTPGAIIAVDGIAITNDGHTLLAGADGADALFDRYRDAALRPERSRSRARGQDCRAVAPALRTELFSFKPSNEMCMTYLRYRPEIEQPEPQGQETIDSIIRGMTQQTETVEQRQRHAARANHAKSSALATGTIEIAAGLPPEKVKLPVFARSNRASYVIAPDGKVIFVYSALDPRARSRRRRRP